jgi:glutamate dehydrogenase
LLAYTKIVLADEILNSDLPDDPYLADRLVNYFPSAMRDRYAAVMPNHRLRREIIATVVVNEFVDASGITCFHRLSVETGASAADIIRAQIAARAIFGAGDQERTIRDFDHRIDAQTQTGLRMEVRTLVERATRWLINNRQRPLDIAAAVDQLYVGVQEVRDALPTLLSTREREAYDKRMQNYRSAGVPEELASIIAALPAAYPALTIVQTAARDGLKPIAVADVHFTLGHRLGLDRLISRIVELPRDDRWQTMARAALRDDLHAAHAQLTAEVLSRNGSGSAKELVAVWERKTPSVAESVKILRTVCAGRPDLARMSVGLRIVRGLLSTPAA